MISDSVSKGLLTLNNLELEFLQLQAQKIMDKGSDFCDLYLQNSLSESWVLDEGIIKSGNYALDSGIGIRSICGEKSFLSYSNILLPDSIKNLVDSLYIEPNKSNVKKSTGINNDHIIERLYLAKNSIYDFNSDYKISLLKKIDNLSRKKTNIINVVASISIEYDQVLIIRGDGRYADDERPLVHLSISLVVKHNNIQEKGYSGFGGRYSLDNVTYEMLIQHINKAYEQAILKCEAKNAPMGKMPIVLGNGWAGIILHEAVGHGLEGDFNRKGSSAFSGKVGERVAAKGVTVIDDGTLYNKRGSLSIDDEGNKTQKNVLIEDGILKGYLLDEFNARLMGLNSTGNGRRETYASCPLPRMTNTYMLGGNYIHEEIINSIDNGLYAESFEGGQVDITSGQFVFNASIAWVIKNGKLAYPVKGCALIGNGPECLKYVSMIGNNAELDSGIGTCGKDGQSVPVGVGQPTIRIDDGLIVGGSN
jgi:TldD protein